jgi:hypothetical protein
LVTGSRVFGRYLLQAELPGPQGQWRWRALDEATGAEVEVIGPDRSAALLPGARQRHAQAADRPTEDLVMPWLQSGLHEGHPVAVRPAVATTWPSAQRITAAQAMALAANLAPAVRRTHGALGGLLRPADLVVRKDGVVALDPAGIVRAPSLARPDGEVPPEGPPSGAGGEAGALYGLGVILFTALTGTAPAVGRTSAHLHQAQLRPTRLRDLQPDADPSIDELLAGLVDPDPARRIAAADALSPQPSPIFDVGFAAPTAQSEASPAPSLLQSDVRLPRWLVVIDPSGRTTNQRRDVAALLGMGLRELDALPPGPLLIEGADTAEQAERLGSLMRHQALGAQVVRGEGAESSGLLGGLSLATIGIAGALGSLLAGLSGIGLIAAVVSASLSGALLMIGGLRLQQGRKVAKVARQVAVAERQRLGQTVPAVVAELARARRAPRSRGLGDDVGG